MITKHHTLSTILSQTFNKEFLSDIKVSEFYQSTMISQLLNFHKEFQIIRKPLLKFFEWQHILPYHYFTGGIQNLGRLPSKYEPFIQIVHKMYNFLELFIYKFDPKELSETNVNLFDMFFQDMYVSYVNDINELVNTINHFVRFKSVIDFFSKLVNAFKYNPDFNQFIDGQIEKGKIIIEHNFQPGSASSRTIEFLDFPMRLIHKEPEYRNAVLKLTPSLIKIIKSLI